MSRERRTPAYFAVSRGIFEHPLFTHGKRPYSRREAWEWLIAQAAWKPKGHRLWLGVVSLDRGQVTASLREMAAAWHWPATNVHRFLHRLQSEEMVLLAKVCNLNATGSENKAAPERARHIITICNYDKFQVGAVQRQDQRPDQASPQLPGIVTEPAPEPYKPQNPSKKELAASETNGLHKPYHRARDRKTGLIWLDYGTDEWAIYARDYRDVRGADILPRSYLDGRGNWFATMGEATRRKAWQGR